MLRARTDLAVNVEDTVPPGPILIFDKSALESLNPDESAWLDNFFLTNITPLFFAETLADLEKQVHAGRTPEAVVGNLAEKTPDMQSSPAAHHSRLLGSDLYGTETVVMDGRILRAGGKVVKLDGKSGVFFEKTKEEEALSRWQRHEFLDLERQIAKLWRRDLSGINHEESYAFFQKWFLMGKPKNLTEVKALTDALIDGSPQQASLAFGMNLLGIPDPAQREIVARWLHEGRPSVRNFALYFRHVYSVDLFFNLAIAADQISRVRPSNKIDLAYLYYLPFCHVFTSSDNLHERVVPLFLRGDQSFVKGQELKADLRKLDDHYSALPEDIKRTGFHKFASAPPDDASFLVTRLWDKHLPGWRKSKTERKEPDQSNAKELIEHLNRIEKESHSSDPSERLSAEETEYVQIQRFVGRKKGKWDRFGSDVR
jgi:hypothetical protein